MSGLNATLQAQPYENRLIRTSLSKLERSNVDMLRDVIQGSQ